MNKSELCAKKAFIS